MLYDMREAASYTCRDPCITALESWYAIALQVGSLHLARPTWNISVVVYTLALRCIW